MKAKTNLIPVLLLLLSFACNPSGANKQDRQEQLKIDNYYLAGKQLYEQHCANCHQIDGKGLGRLYPPLAGSDYLSPDPLKIICISKYGLEGEVMVNDIMYNQVMPGVQTLTNLEIAEIATYVLNNWGNEEGLVRLDSVRNRLNACVR